MAMIFLVKRDPGVPAGDGNWIRMDGRQFRSFLRTPEGQSRKGRFGIVDSCGSDSLIVIETDGNTVCELRRQRNRNSYVKKNLRDALERHGMHIVSYGEEESICSEAFLPVETPLSVEETVEKDLETELIRKAFGKLEREEKTLIRYCVIGEEPVTEAMYGEITGRSREEVHAEKRRILRKLRREMEKELICV